MLIDAIRQMIFNHIKSNAADKGIYLDCVNGYLEHVHALISLGHEQTIAKVMQMLKGESAYWVNKQCLIQNGKLEWQTEYFAVSVSESGVDSVRNYIWNQEEHHRKKTFKEEYNEFIYKYGFQKFG